MFAGARFKIVIRECINIGLRSLLRTTVVAAIVKKCEPRKSGSLLDNKTCDDGKSINQCQIDGLNEPQFEGGFCFFYLYA